MSPRTTVHWSLIAVLASAPSWMSAQPLQAARSCEPAVIDSVISNNPLCPGDHIDLAVVASGDILGYSWEGPGTGTFFTFTPAYSFTFQVLGEYTIVVYGTCGNDTASITMSAQGAGAGHDDTLHLCDPGPPRSLALALGPHAEGGTWTFNGLPHGGIYDPASDLPGDYVYASPFPVTCPGMSPQATITVLETAVGPDMAWSICSADSAFGLAQALAPQAAPGGTWYRSVFLSLEPHGGTYDPAVDSSGVFRYSIGGCMASVTVTEIPALPWFEDLDNDSLGDPLAPITWSCTQPPGLVADSTDNCATLPGRAGSPCDDGLEETVDDAITDSCTCAGSLPTGLGPPQDRSLSFSIWPNPNAGESLYLRTPAAGPGELRAYDALGRLELVLPITFSNAPLRIPLAGRLAKGVHLVRIIVNGRSGAALLTVQ